MARTPNIDLREDYGRNHIINGNFDFWQRFAANLAIINTTATTETYVADRFSMYASGTSNKFVVSQRSTAIPTQAESGAQSTYSWAMTSQAAHPMANANDIFVPLQYKMEGYDYSLLIGKKINISFWTRSSTTGQHSISLINGAATRSYVTTFNIDVADTWQKVSVNVDIEADAASSVTNGIGLYLLLGTVLGTGSTTETSTLDAWQAGVKHAATGSVNTLANSADNIYFSQVQITEGGEELPFRRAGKSIAEEFSLCQRYYEKSYEVDIVPGSAVSFAGVKIISVPVIRGNFTGVKNEHFKVDKRAIPTTIIYSFLGSVNTISTYDTGANFGAIGLLSVSSSGYGFTQNSGGNMPVGFYSYHYAADAEL